MPVGNDVVDLGDPETRPDSLHPRFDLRVFTPHERHLIGAAPSGEARHALRWALWAAKESVFKLVLQLDQSVRFLPRSFQVGRLAAGVAEVRFRETVYPVELEVGPELVHAVTIGAAGTLNGRERLTHHVRCSVDGDPSSTVRTEAAKAVGDRLGIPHGEVDITRRVPRATHNGKTLPVDISLSHHGRFVAHAVLGSALFLALGLGGCAESTGPEDGPTASRLVWESSGIESYTFVFEQACFCAFAGPVRITVEDAAVTAAEPLGTSGSGVPLSHFPTIDDLFDRLVSAADSDPEVYEVLYHPDLGFPVSAVVDISRQIADEEFSFEVREFAAAQS